MGRISSLLEELSAVSNGGRRVSEQGNLDDSAGFDVDRFLESLLVTLEGAKQGEKEQALAKALSTTLQHSSSTAYSPPGHKTSMSSALPDSTPRQSQARSKAEPSTPHMHLRLTPNGSVVEVPTPRRSPAALPKRDRDDHTLTLSSGAILHEYSATTTPSFLREPTSVFHLGQLPEEPPAYDNWKEGAGETKWSGEPYANLAAGHDGGKLLVIDRSREPQPPAATGSPRKRAFWNAQLAAAMASGRPLSYQDTLPQAPEVKETRTQRLRRLNTQGDSKGPTPQPSVRSAPGGVRTSQQASVKEASARRAAAPTNTLKKRPSSVTSSSSHPRQRPSRPTHRPASTTASSRSKSRDKHKAQPPASTKDAPSQLQDAPWVKDKTVDHERLRRLIKARKTAASEERRLAHQARAKSKPRERQDRSAPSQPPQRSKSTGRGRPKSAGNPQRSVPGRQRSVEGTKSSRARSATRQGRSRLEPSATASRPPTLAQPLEDDLHAAEMLGLYNNILGESLAQHTTHFSEWTRRRQGSSNSAAMTPLQRPEQPPPPPHRAVEGLPRQPEDVPPGAAGAALAYFDEPSDALDFMLSRGLVPPQAVAAVRQGREEGRAAAPAGPTGHKGGVTRYKDFIMASPTDLAASMAAPRVPTDAADFLAHFKPPPLPPSIMPEEYSPTEAAWEQQPQQPQQPQQLAGEHRPVESPQHSLSLGGKRYAALQRPLPPTAAPPPSLAAAPAPGVPASMYNGVDAPQPQGAAAGPNLLPATSRYSNGSYTASFERKRLSEAALPRPGPAHHKRVSRVTMNMSARRKADAEEKVNALLNDLRGGDSDSEGTAGGAESHAAAQQWGRQRLGRASTRISAQQLSQSPPPGPRVRHSLDTRASVDNAVGHDDEAGEPQLRVPRGLRPEPELEMQDDVEEQPRSPPPKASPPRAAFEARPGLSTFRPPSPEKPSLPTEERKEEGQKQGTMGREQGAAARKGRNAWVAAAEARPGQSKREAGSHPPAMAPQAEQEGGQRGRQGRHNVEEPREEEEEYSLDFTAQSGQLSMSNAMSTAKHPQGATPAGSVSGSEDRYSDGFVSDEAQPTPGSTSPQPSSHVAATRRQSTTSSGGGDVEEDLLDSTVQHHNRGGTPTSEEAADALLHHSLPHSEDVGQSPSQPRSASAGSRGGTDHGGSVSGGDSNDDSWVMEDMEELLPDTSESSPARRHWGVVGSPGFPGQDIDTVEEDESLQHSHVGSASEPGRSPPRADASAVVSEYSLDFSNDASGIM